MIHLGAGSIPDPQPKNKSMNVPLIVTLQHCLEALFTFLPVAILVGATITALSIGENE